MESVFLRNGAVNCGGVLSINVLSKVKIANCKFYNNTAQTGGALAALQASSIQIDSFFLKNNSLFDNSETDISRNMANFGGGLYLSESKFYLKMITDVCKNQASISGGGIYAINSSLFVQNTVNFRGNQAKHGGGIYLNPFSKLYDTIKEGVFNFVSNQAEYGGALYIYDDKESSVCYNDPHKRSYFPDSGCFFENITKCLAISFTNNYYYARFNGTDLYGGLLDRCTVVNITKSPYQLELSGLARFREISNIDNLVGIGSRPVRVCLCSNNVPDCSLRTHHIQIKRGEKFSIQAVAVNQVEQPTIATFQSQFHYLSLLSENQSTRRVDAKCSLLDYQLSFPQADREYELVIFTEGPCGRKGISKLEITVNVINCSCPPGFMPSTFTTDCNCICDSQLSAYIKRCDYKTSSIIREENIWITYLKDFDHDDSYHYLIIPHCPLNYCQPSTKSVHINLNLSNGSDAQCSSNRGGLLCGSCQSKFSLSLGSSKCIKCPEKWYSQLIGIIIATLLAGILLVTLLLVLNLTVAIGTLNAIIFYANIIDANRSLYLTQKCLTFIPMFISWLNMDIGFDVCFYEGMDSYEKTWLQLAFPAYIIVLVIIIIFVSSFSLKFSRIIGKRNPVATLATLILLSYTRFLGAIITSLSFVTLEYPNGTREIKWSLDAKVDYSRGKHIPLVIIAILIVVGGLLYTILIFSWQWLLSSSRINYLWLTRKQKLHYFILTYHNPYTTKHHYWTGLLLFVRVIIYLISSLCTSVDPQITLLSTLIVICCLMLFMNILAIRPYREWMLNAMESLAFFNITVFTAVTWYTSSISDTYDQNKETLQILASYFSVGAVILQLFLVISFHIYRYVIMTVHCFNRMGNLSRRLSPQLSQDRSEDLLTSEERDCYRNFELSDSHNEHAAYSPPRLRQQTTSSVSLSECEEL